MRVIANLSLMFKSKPLLERYSFAQKYGFKLVELPFVYTESANALKEEANKNGLQHILINTKNDDTLGALTCRSGHEDEFKKNIDITMEYATTLGCSIVHVMAGNVIPENGNDEATYVKNLKYACQLFGKKNILIVIEPLNRYDFPQYFLNSYDQAKRVIEQVNEPNLKILYDFYHAQLINGQITHTLKSLHEQNLVGHIQVSQPIGRHEPNTEGELNFDYIFKLLKEFKLDVYIGAEYMETQDNADWVNKYGLSF